MTINATLGRRVAIASADQTEFTFNFTIQEAADIAVYQRAQNATPSNSDLLTLTQDYTVTIDGDNGGNVILNTGASENDYIIIELNKNYSRAADYTAAKQYTAGNVNDDMDNNLQGQKQNDMRYQSLTPHYFDSESLTETRDLRLPKLGANQAWRMNTAGTAIAPYTTPDDDPGAAILRSDLASTGGAAIVGTDDGYGTVQQSLDAGHDRGPYYAVDTGSANAVVVTLSPAPSAYITGEVLIVKVSNQNTAAVTINKNGLGAVPITDFTGSPLPAGAFQVNQIVALVYTGSSYIFSNNTVTSNLMPGYINGLLISNASSDTDHDLQIATGVCRDTTDSFDLRLSSTLTKRIDANWGVGDDQGGFPSGLTLSADSTYGVWLIAKTDGTVDAGFDNAATPTNLLADATDYIYFRRLGYVLTDSSSNIVQFTQRGFWFMHNAPFDYIVTNSNDGSTTEITLKNPTLKSLFILYMATHTNPGVGDYKRVLLTSPLGTSYSPTDDRNDAGAIEGSGIGYIGDSGIKNQVITSATGTVRRSFLGNGGAAKLTCLGWYDDLTHTDSSY